MAPRISSTIASTRVAKDGSRTKVARPTLLRRLNERAVFDTVRELGPLTRADLTRHFDVSSATVSKAVAHLLKTRLLEECEEEVPEPADGGRNTRSAGRPGKPYRIAKETAQVIGVTIDANYCGVLAAGIDGSVDSERTIEFPTPDTYRKILNRIVEAATTLINDTPAVTLGMGVSVPGSLDAGLQQVLLSPNLHVLDNQFPADDLQERLGLKAVIVHGPIGACLAEQAFGAARGLSDFVRIGTYEGFGVSVITGGEILQGHRGMAGEVGHITVERNGLPCGCGNRGCLETRATDLAFARAVSKRLSRKLTIDAILQEIRDGNLDPADVREELDEAIEYLAIGVGSTINIFNPQAVLVFSRMLDVEPTAFDRLKKLTAQHAMAPLLDECDLRRTGRIYGLGAIASIIDHLVRELGPRFN